MIAVLTTAEMLIATVTGSSISLILLAALVVWFRFPNYLPVRASEFMREIVEPQGLVAVLITLVVVAIVAGVVVDALRLHRFTLICALRGAAYQPGLGGQANGDHPRRPGAGRSYCRGVLAMPLGYCSLQVEVAGIGRANTNQRMLFPLVRADRANR